VAFVINYLIKDCADYYFRLLKINDFELMKWIRFSKTNPLQSNFFTTRRATRRTTRRTTRRGWICSWRGAAI
jgi:hypothetical protein